MKFSERLKQFRTDRGLTQNELAGKASITARSLQRYESGASFPRMPAIEKLAEALGLQISGINARINGKTDFRASEISKIRKRYNLTPEEVCKIFFSYEAS